MSDPTARLRALLNAMDRNGIAIAGVPGAEHGQIEAADLRAVLATLDSATAREAALAGALRKLDALYRDDADLDVPRPRWLWDALLKPSAAAESLLARLAAAERERDRLRGWARRWKELARDLFRRRQSALDTFRHAELVAVGNGHMDITASRDFATLWIAHFRTLLDTYGGQNYAWIDFTLTSDGTRYCMTIMRPNGKTPQEMRVQAETDRDAALAERDRLRVRVAELEKNR